MTTALFSLYQSQNNQFLSEAYNGRLWSSVKPVQNTGGISDTPGAVALNDKLYNFYARDHVLYYNNFDGERWTSEAPVPDTAGVNTGVAAVLHGQLIYLLYSNPNQTSLVYKTFDGTTFGPDKPVKLVNFSHPNGPLDYGNLDTPAAVVFKNDLYVFCTGTLPVANTGSTYLWYARANQDATRWEVAGPPSEGEKISSGPGVAVFDDKLNLLANIDGVLCRRTWDRTVFGWSRPLPLPGSPVSIGNPGTISYDGKLYVMYQAPGGVFLYRTFDGKEWSADMPVPGARPICSGPAVATFAFSAAMP